MIQCLDRLKELDCDSSEDRNVGYRLDSIEESLAELAELCFEEGSGNAAAIATRNGALELVCSLCRKIRVEHKKALFSALKAMAVLLHGM